jgi:hypothetical protein
MKFDQNIESRYGITLVDEFTVRKEAQLSTREGFEYIQAVVNHFIRNPDPMVVPVYKFEVIEATPEDESRYGKYVYAYEMMRLGMLDQDERNVLDHSYQFINRKAIPSDTTITAIQHGWQACLNLMNFINTVFSQGRYTDIHSGNFMKDPEGQYRIIDLEGFSGGAPLNQPKNDWIIR